MDPAPVAQVERRFSEFAAFREALVELEVGLGRTAAPETEPPNVAAPFLRWM